jgi:hypothetical protein
VDSEARGLRASMHASRPRPRYRAISRLEVGVTDLPSRDLHDDVLAAIDVDAGRLGLSCSEYPRRTLTQTAARVGGAVTSMVEDLPQFRTLFASNCQYSPSRSRCLKCLGPGMRVDPAHISWTAM